MAYPVMGAEEYSLHQLDLTSEFQAKNVTVHHNNLT